MNALIIDKSGNVLDVRGPIEREDANEIIGGGKLVDMPVGTTIEMGGVIMRKMENVGGETFTIFFRK